MVTAELQRALYPCELSRRASSQNNPTEVRSNSSVWCPHMHLTPAELNLYCSQHPCSSLERSLKINYPSTVLCLDYCYITFMWEGAVYNVSSGNRNSIFMDKVALTWLCSTQWKPSTFFKYSKQNSKQLCNDKHFK